MTRVAAVDCGTNSLRLLVADLPPAHPQPSAVVDVQGGVGGGVGGGAKTDVHREMRIVRLGEGVDRTGELAPEALERTRVALVDYAATVRELGVERTRLVATSATRDARNRHLFVEMVADTLGVEPDVVTGDEEAALSFRGATAGLDAPAPFLVMDIGGGSTELVLGGDEVTAARSVDVGCVRLTERHLRADPPTREQVAAARADVEEALALARQTVPVEEAVTAVGVAGSVTTVAAMALGLPSYQPERIHRSRLSARQVRDVSDRLLAMTHDERAALPFMHPGRVDVIGGGALVLRTLVDRLGLEEVVVSETDILDGIALSLA